MRPFGISAIIGGWDSEEELPVDGQVGNGPKIGAGGKQPGKVREGGPSLYMIEPSGLYWVLDAVAIMKEQCRLTLLGILRRSGRERKTSGESRAGEDEST